MSDVMSMFGSLLKVPLLPGARCRGRHHLFDEPASSELPEVVEQRQFQAVGLCLRSCPSLDACREWVDGLPPSQRPPGVTAGLINNKPKPNWRKPA